MQVCCSLRPVISWWREGGGGSRGRERRANSHLRQLGRGHVTVFSPSRRCRPGCCQRRHQNWAPDRWVRRWCCDSRSQRQSRTKTSSACSAPPLKLISPLDSALHLASCTTRAMAPRTEMTARTTEADKTRIWWSNGAFFVGVHIAAVAGMWYIPPARAMRQTLLLAILLWQAASMG